jgi:hypothetical protein
MMEKVTGQVVVRYSRLMVEPYDESVARPLSPRRETHGRYVGTFITLSTRTGPSLSNLVAYYAFKG